MKTTKGSYRTQDGKAQIEWSLEPKENGLEFSATGDFDGGSGQCIDSIEKAYPADAMVQRIAKVWSEYHLNGMNAGLPAQEAEIARRLRENPEDLKAAPHNGDHYAFAVGVLKAAGLHEIPLPEGAQATGGFPEEVTNGTRGYRYGERWVYLPIPADVLAEIESWSSGPQPTEPLHDAKANAFLADHGLQFRATLSDTKPAPWSAGEYRPHFRVTINREAVKGAAGRLAFDFWGGIEDRKMSACSVLSCIASDLSTPTTFEDFCSEYGEEQDSRKALQTFRRATRHADRLRAFFTGEEQEAFLREIR